MLRGFWVFAFLAWLPATSFGGEEVRWFLVSEIDVDKNDSYLLPLSDPDAIAMARSLVANGPGGEVGSIATVKIAAGSDGFNRNVLADGEPLWSWHVVAFEGFSDFTIELCDGWPGFVEEDVEAFLQNTDATICFWGYTVTAELEQGVGYRVTNGDEGGWYNPSIPGQGLMFDVIPGSGGDPDQLFTAWFTFDHAAAKVGAAGQRWLTGQGPLSDGTVTLDLFNTSGGEFISGQQVTTEPVGQLILDFVHCNAIEATYQLDSQIGSFQLERLAPGSGCP